MPWSVVDAYVWQALRWVHGCVCGGGVCTHVWLCVRWPRCKKSNLRRSFQFGVPECFGSNDTNADQSPTTQSSRLPHSHPSYTCHRVCFFCSQKKQPFLPYVAPAVTLCFPICQRMNSSLHAHLTCKVGDDHVRLPHETFQVQKVRGGS